MGQALLYELCIDWPMLTQQKLHLLALIDADCESESGLTPFGPYSAGAHPLDGLVQVLDAMQDQGEDAGEPVFPDSEEASDVES